MKYKMSYSSNLRITSKDRNSIESMLSMIGESQSMGYQPKGRTRYSIVREDNGFLVTIQRFNGADQEQIAVHGVDLN
jgi:hypothetical protein